MRAGIGLALAIAALVIGVLIILAVLPATPTVVGTAIVLLAAAALA